MYKEQLVRYSNYTIDAVESRTEIFPDFILEQLNDLKEKRDVFSKILNDTGKNHEKRTDFKSEKEELLKHAHQQISLGFSRLKSLDQYELVKFYFKDSTPSKVKGDLEKTVKLLTKILTAIKKKNGEGLEDLQPIYTDLKKNLTTLTKSDSSHKDSKNNDSSSIQSTMKDLKISYRKLKGYIKSFLLDHRTDHRVFFLELYHSKVLKHETDLNDDDY